jgi:F-type H+-transporting ATPase subunit delta
VIGYTLAKRYAHALIDLAREAKQVDRVAAEIGELATVFAASPALTDFFANPTMAPAAKAEALGELLSRAGVEGLTADFARLLLAKHRLLGLPEIARAFRDQWDNLHNRVRARLVSAFPLGPEETARARKALSAISGKEVVLAVEVDPGIIGGLVAHVGGNIYDGSIRNQLAQFAERMHEGR